MIMASTCYEMLGCRKRWSRLIGGVIDRSVNATKLIGVFMSTGSKIMLVVYILAIVVVYMTNQ